MDAVSMGEACVETSAIVALQPKFLLAKSTGATAAKANSNSEKKIADHKLAMMKLFGSKVKIP